MGTIIHHAIIATACTDDFSKLVALVGARGDCWVSDMGINAYRTFFLAPDGSKESWAESDTGDDLRDDVVKWLSRDDFYGEWCEIAMGELPGHDSDAIVTRRPG